MIELSLKSWEKLSKIEFHDIIQLRETVFIIEQQCSYLDVDGKDPDSFHLFYTENNNIIAYCRLIPKGISYKDSTSIGRFLVDKNFRGKGIAKKLIVEAINQSKVIFNTNKITISGQAYLKDFYESFGFKTQGEVYLEDHIPHYKMILEK